MLRQKQGSGPWHAPLSRSQFYRGTVAFNDRFCRMARKETEGSLLS